MPVVKPKEEEVVEQPTFGAPAPQAQAVGQGAAPKPASEPKGSGMFTNLNKFIDANKGASEQMAGGLAGELGKEGSTAQSGIEKEQTSFLGGMKAAPTYTKGTITTETSADQLGGFADVAKVDTDEQQLWGNPNFKVSEAARTAATNTAQSIANTATSGGLGETVGSQAKKRGQAMTGGERSFDTLLLGLGGAGVAKPFADVREQYKGLGGAASVAEKAVSDEGANRLAAATAVAQLVQKDIESARGGIYGAGQTLADAVNLAAAQQMDDWQGRQVMSADPNNPLAISGSSYIVNPQAQASALSQLTPQQVAQLNALKRLQGYSGDYYSPETYSGPVFDAERWEQDRANIIAADQVYTQRLQDEWNAARATPPQEMPTIAPLTSTIASLPGEAWSGLTNLFSPVESVVNPQIDYLNAPTRAVESGLGLPKVSSAVGGAIKKASNPSKWRI